MICNLSDTCPFSKDSRCTHSILNHKESPGCHNEWCSISNLHDALCIDENDIEFIVKKIISNL